MRRWSLLLTILLLGEPASAHEDLFGAPPKQLKAGSRTGYQVWMDKHNKVKVRWTSDGEKSLRFHGSIEAEGLWTEADRIVSGPPGSGVKITGGGGLLQWDTETGKWIDGFDAVHNPTQFLRFSFWIDGKRADPKSILLGPAGRPAKYPVFYWLAKPVPDKWPGGVEGFPSVSPGKETAFYIGTGIDGYMFVKMNTQGDEKEVKFTGTITAEGGRIDLLSGLEKEVDERVKLAKENQIQFEFVLKGAVDGFKFRPGGGARKLEIELNVDGQEVKPEQVYLGANATHPKKTNPLVLTR